MTPQAETKPTQKPASDVVEHRQLSGLVLYEATRFNHSDSINTGKGVAIVAARVTATGDWRPTSGDERPEGFGISELRGAGGERRMCRAFIPLSNIREVIYGP